MTAGNAQGRTAGRPSAGRSRKTRDFMGGYETRSDGQRGDPAQWAGAFNDRVGGTAGRRASRENQAGNGAGGPGASCPCDLNSRNPRTVLGLGPSCTWADVRSAYRRLARIHHPDAGGSAEAFRKVQAAYDALNEVM